MERIKTKERLDALIIEGLESGPCTPMTPEDWVEIQREGERIFAARKARVAARAAARKSRDSS